MNIIYNSPKGPVLLPSYTEDIIQAKLSFFDRIKQSLVLSNPTAPVAVDAEIEHLESLWDEVVIIDGQNTNQETLGTTKFDVSTGRSLSEIVEALADEYPGIKEARLVEAYMREDGTARWIFKKQGI